MFYLPLFGLIALLLILFFWSLRRPTLSKPVGDQAAAFEDSGPRHITFFPQIRQALEPADLAYLASRGPAGLRRRVRKERRRVALFYVTALRGDFQRLLRLARVIAVLSPEVGAVHEFERLRLSVQFSCRCQLLRLRLVCRLAPLPELSGLSCMVSAFAVRMEVAMKELGERAALAAELASSLEGRGIDSH
jgi:hypothetical protein